MKLASLLAPSLIILTSATWAQVPPQSPTRPNPPAPMPPSPGLQLTRRAYGVAQQIERTQRSLKPTEIEKINGYYNSIQAVLEGGGPVLAKLICLAKDNDNRDPWQIAFEIDPVTVKRLPQAVVGSKADCENAILNARILQDEKILVCASKDGDGRNPRVLSLLDPVAQTASVISRSVTSDDVACARQRKDLRETEKGLYFCSSKDRDGRRPFVLVFRSNDGTESVGQDEFGTYEDCTKRLQF